MRKRAPSLRASNRTSNSGPVRLPRTLPMIRVRSARLKRSIEGRKPYHARVSEEAPRPAKEAEVKPLAGFLKELYDAFVALGVGAPVTLAELRRQLGLRPHEHQQLRRRIKELQDHGYNAHRLERKRGPDWLYVLESSVPNLPTRHSGKISVKIRAEVIHSAGRRCQMCGKSVEDGIKLVVDHRMPREWGGTDDVTNLEALCEECNGGKKAFFRGLDPKLMTRCMAFENPVQRIGELLKAFKGEAPPRRLIATVAMEDEWTRRLRELRDLGWKVKEVRVKGQRGANRFTYQVVESKPWPADIRKAIRDAAARRGSRSL